MRVSKALLSGFAVLLCLLFLQNMAGAQEISASETELGAREDIIYNEAEFEAAIAEFEKIVKLEPDNKKAAAILDMLRDQAKKKREAQKFYNQGTTMASEGRWDKAYTAFEVALKLEPHNTLIKKAFLESRDHLVSERKYTMEFKDGDLKEILLGLGKVSGMNIMVPDDMEDKVTVAFAEMTFHEALRQVLSGSMYTYEEEKDFVRVVPKEKKVITETIAPTERIVNQVFRDIAFQDLMVAFKRMLNINIIFDSSVADILEKPVTLFISDMTLQETFNLILKMQGIVAKKFNQNTYIIMTPDAAKDSQFDRDRRIQHVFKLRNVKPDYVKKLIDETKGLKDVINTDYWTTMDKRSQGTELQDGAGFTGILVYDTPENLKLIKEFIKEIDIKRKQATISVRIMEIEAKTARELGLDVDFTPADANDDGRHLDVKLFQDFKGRLVWKDDPDVVGKIVRNFNLSAMLNFLDEKNLSRTIASPSIRVIDGESASIAIQDTVIVKEYKYIVAPGDVTAGGGVETGVEYKEVPFGINLNITPFIHDKEVTLQFELTKDTPVESIIDELGTHYGKSGTTTTTIVRVKDGETVIMGGLIEKTRAESTEKVPFLDRIPLLGDLLRNSSVRDTRNKEMVIFMTPYITGNENETDNDVRKKEMNALDFSGSENYAEILKGLKKKLYQGPQ